MCKKMMTKSNIGVAKNEGDWAGTEEVGQDHMIHVKMQLTVEKR